MKPETFILELEELCEQAGYRIRKERGNFRGDSCIMEGDRLVILNKNRPAEVQAGVLAKVLKSAGTEEIYIKPAVRKKLTEIWDRMEMNGGNKPEGNPVQESNS